MKSYYYALWIPQYQEGIPTVKKYCLEEVSLQDRPEDPPLWVSAEVNPSTQLISLKYRIDGNEARTLLFHKIVSNDKGFIIYKLNLDDDEQDFLCERFRVTMPKAIYHFIKNFFHNHQFHNADDDSLLDAYFSESEINLADAVHVGKIIHVYINSYVNKYAGAILLSREILNEANQNITKGYKLEATRNELLLAIEKNRVIIDGESLYCDFLVNSFPEAISLAQLQHLYILRDEFSHYDGRLQQLEASLSSKQSLKLGWMGLYASIIGALAGLVVSLVLSRNSDTEFDENINTVCGEIHKVQAFDSLLNQHLQHLQQRQDSALRLLNRKD